MTGRPLPRLAAWLRPRADSLIAQTAALVVAAAVARLSFVATSSVAAGEPPVTTGAVAAGDAWLVPVVVEGMMVAAAAVARARRHLPLRAKVYPWAVMAVGMAAAAVVNVAHVAAASVPADLTNVGLALVLSPALLASLHLAFGHTPTAPGHPGHELAEMDEMDRPHAEAVATVANTPARRPATLAAELAASEPLGLVDVHPQNMHHANDTAVTGADHDQALADLIAAHTGSREDLYRKLIDRIPGINSRGTARRRVDAHHQQHTTA